MTFSSTVIESKLRTTWNVRAMPASTQATGPRPLMRAPSSLISPRSGVTWPAIELNSEVLPAPFGPIRPRISPCCTSKLISTFAATPPNDLLTRSTSSSTRALRHVAGDVARSAHADAEQARQTLRAQQSDAHDQRAVDHQVGPPPRPAEVAARQLRQRDQHGGADQRSPQRADAAQHRGQRDQDRQLAVHHALGVDVADILRIDRAADPGQPAADRR